MTWINFRELQDKLDFGDVLRHYGVEINAKNRIQHHGPCPLPTHTASKRSPTFSANLEKGIWRCFGRECQAQGNIIDFAVRMNGFEPGNPQDVRRTALMLAETFKITTERPRSARMPQKTPSPSKHAVLVNAPLDFTLKNLDPTHPYLLGRGFSPETIAHFELGYCSRGLMAGRIAIPLHDAENRLIGYGGRLVDESLVTDENPKYRFPTARDRNGKRYDFSKDLFLYNGSRVETPADDLVIVQGFPATWWLQQHGHRNTVAVMGSSCSREQARLIVGMVGRRGRIWVFTNGSKVGRYCGEEILRHVAPYRFVRQVELADGQKPTDCNSDELKGFFA